MIKRRGNPIISLYWRIVDNPTGLDNKLGGGMSGWLNTFKDAHIDMYGKYLLINSILPLLFLVCWKKKHLKTKTKATKIIWKTCNKNLVSAS